MICVICPKCMSENISAYRTDENDFTCEDCEFAFNALNLEWVEK